AGRRDAHDEFPRRRRAGRTALEDEAVAEAGVTGQRFERMRSRAGVTGFRAHQGRQLSGYLFEISGHMRTRRVSPAGLGAFLGCLACENRLRRDYTTGGSKAGIQFRGGLRWEEAVM